MAKSENQKLKLLYIIDILEKESDEEHPISTQELIERLAEYDIKAERKAIYNDMECLCEFGYDIIHISGKNGGYCLGNRRISLPELKLLVDAVQSSKFITVKKSRDLISKLSGMVSKYDSVHLNRQVDVFNRVKTMNESIYYNVDYLHRAMNNNREITFKYFDLDYKKEKILRHEGKIYRVSPWSLCWDDENYYLISYDEESASIRHFRVDKMIDIRQSQEMRKGKEVFSEFDRAAYSKQVFGMFSGTPEAVVLRCRKNLAHILFDRFGTDLSVRSIDDEYFETTVKVIASPPFFSWVFQFGGDVSIVSPSSVIVKYKELLNNVNNMII